LAPEARLDFVRAIRRADRFVQVAGAPAGSILEDVFINRRGQIWDAEGNFVRRAADPLPEASRRAMAAAPVVDDLAFGRGGEANRNFYHWTAETLPSLSWCLDAERSPMPVSISVDAARFVTESLVLAARHAVTVVPVGDAIRVRRLHMGSILVWMLAFRDLHAPMFARMAARAMESAAEPGDGERLYISRGDSGRRPLANEAALEKALAQRGFTIVAMSTLPLARQIALARRARLVVAPHGAGLTHLIFAEPGCRVVEIFPAAIGTHPARIGMARISRIFGHAHTIWLEAGRPEDAAWMASIAPLLRMIDRG
jgi:capsular polysaccharide biosynthesis protein